MQFHEIDTKKWKRNQIFYYFTQMAPTGYSITVDLDITIMKNALNAANKKFFPAYLYLVTRNLNKQEEFKMAVIEDKLGYWDLLTPMYASFHEDDKTISLMWTEYNEDFEVFYKDYHDNQNQFANNHGILAQPHIPPPLTAIRYLACLGSHSNILRFIVMKINLTIFRQ